MSSRKSKINSRPSWGLLPVDVIDSLRQKHWQNLRKLKSLLIGHTIFPLEIPLKPPKGSAVLEDINHFQKFVASWKVFPDGRGSDGKEPIDEVINNSQSAISKWGEVRWDIRTFRSLDQQDIPTHLIISDISSLAFLLGNNEEQQLRKWQSKIDYIFDSLQAEFEKYDYASNKSFGSRELFKALINHLETLDKFEEADLKLLVKLIPQLNKGMGKGCYLRALPVTFVDTKFIEKNLRIVESLTTVVIDRAVKEVGLLTWLHCKKKPKDWLLIKPLCEKTVMLLGGVSLLRLSSDTLLEFELPANNILVIENEQSCLALNNIPDTIAVSGGGKNVAWMEAGWLFEKNVGYWGDIDSEGFSILSNARSKLSSITPLMMDSETVEIYQDRMVAEPNSVSKVPIALTEEELSLFKKLRAKHYANTRLEQERLPMDYVIKQLKSWLR